MKIDDSMMWTTFDMTPQRLTQQEVLDQQHFQEQMLRQQAYHHSMRPYPTKITLAMQRACEQLPFRLAGKIREIRFGPEGTEHPQFEVVFVNGKVIEFDNVDTFPTDADIGRIAVECP